LIEQMMRAITIIENLDPSDAVPHTWHGLEIGGNSPDSI